MQFEFIKDLDDYFCEAYANYDRLCLLPGYVMPKMQETKVDAFGDVVAYSLPANTMRLSLQENKAAILKTFKEKIADGEFSFSFTPVPWHKRIRNFFSKKAYHKQFSALLKKNSIDAQAAVKGLAIEEEIWQKILFGAYLPTKNLIFSLALASNMSYADTKELLAGIGCGFDYTKVRDTVIAYLLFKRIANPAMQQVALEEYGVKNLFLCPQD